MKALLIVTALIEAGAGLALVVSPAVPVWLLFGTALETPTASVIGRVAGAACFPWERLVGWRHDAQSRAATGLIAAMLLYNIAVMALLSDAGLRSGLLGVALWPGLVLHVAMAVWCLACLRIKRGFDR